MNRKQLGELKCKYFNLKQTGVLHSRFPVFVIINVTKSRERETIFIRDIIEYCTIITKE